MRVRLGLGVSEHGKETVRERVRDKGFYDI